MRRRPGSANPMACSGPGNATADGSSKISAVRFRAESSCGRFDVCFGKLPPAFGGGNNDSDIKSI